ncbi:TonB family protein [Spirosoma spitsbergense]|uniref:TonB family protein n=1 Tax=Spirosoma spitsbergense TaxID=431554 RepID=UPI0003781C8C|nr:TonB family protein [Spirosoma spitsbergense]
MNVRLLPLLLLFCFPSFAQQPVYKEFEVDSTAQPRGGMSFLNTYLQTNLRKPTPIEAEGIGGRAILSAVVEPDGRLSSVTVLKGLHPDLDREAVRAVSLFQAWKPAKKGGQVVRQQTVIPVAFAKNTPFVYQNGAKILYFDADSKLVDSTQARYKQSTLISAEGQPAGYIVLYEQKGKSWKEINRSPLIRKLKSYQNDAGKWVHQVGHQNADLRWEGLLVETDEDGNRFRQAYYKNGKRVDDEFVYYPVGMVARKIESLDSTDALTSWYPNGQIKEIRTGARDKQIGAPQQDKVIAFWDNTGKQLVADGNGQATFIARRKSCNDTIQYTNFIEQGSFKNGLKHGDWSGRYADGSYFYKETYWDGAFKGGKNRTGQADTVFYGVIEQQPEFPEGMAGLGKFLSENLQYPVNAQKAGVQGKVFVSFVVCTDGTLCDYTVLKGVHPDVDQEALRVVKKMSGRWKPGVQRGQKVRVKYNLPINFSLY